MFTIIIYVFKYLQIVKKEIIGLKGQFYNNYDQRRDIPSDGYPNTVIGSVTNIAIHNYGSAQMSNKHNAGSAKGRFANAANMQDGYFQGYYGKQQPQEFYGKYEPEFGQPHKPLNATDQKSPEFHHIKADYHHVGNVKSELSHSKLADFHHSKASAPANFHQSHQNFYSPPSQQQQQPDKPMPEGHRLFPQHGAVGSGATQAHQVPSIQYPNQYYPDFDAPGMEQNYYEQRAAAAAGAQTNYYDGMYQPQPQIQPQQAQYDYGAAPPANQLQQHEACDNYGAAYSQQYFEGGVGMGQANAQLHATAAITNSHHGGPHTAHGQMHSGQVPQNFNHPPHAYHAAQHAANGLNGNAVAIGHHLDNSNSSSDFNFLSNLANDFAPDYYQLS